MENFLVKNTFSNRLCVVSGTNVTMAEFAEYRRFIEIINQRFNNSFGGYSLGSYYGVLNGDSISLSESRFFYRDGEFSNLKVVTPKEAISILGGLDMNYEDCVVTWNGQFHSLSDGDIEEITSEDSKFFGSYAFSSELVDLAVGAQGTALNSECSRLYGSEYFVTEQARHYDISYSDYNDQYICRSDDYSFYGYIGVSGNTGWFSNEDYVYCPDFSGDESYFADAYIAEHYNVRWNDLSGEYEENTRYGRDVSNANAGYHSSRLDRTHKEPQAEWKIGFEVEKEDDDVGLIHYKELYDRTRWIKESDGSLNNDGYELISPSYDLFSNLIDEDVQDKDIKSLINGDYDSDRCGGHIHISCKSMNTEIVFEGLSGFFPLLYAMYEDRTSVNYCQAKKKHEYYRKDKYSAVYIRDCTVEFRIFSAVKNVNNMLWRRDLMRIMVENFNRSELDVLRMMVNQKSKLHQHLRKVYTHEAIIRKVDDFLRYAELFCNKKINKPIIRKKENESIEVSHSFGA